jgi:hypothetical protein
MLTFRVRPGHFVNIRRDPKTLECSGKVIWIFLDTPQELCILHTSSTHTYSRSECRQQLL